MQEQEEDIAHVIFGLKCLKRKVKTQRKNFPIRYRQNKPTYTNMR